MGCCTSQYRLTASTVARRHLKNKNLSGKVALVTGTTSGLGYETALVLAMNGAHVILTGRNEKKLKQAEEKLTKAVSKLSSPPPVTSIPLDLQSFESIRTAARRVAALCPALHLLVLNAGIMVGPYEKTVEGIESTFGTNHVGHMLLFMCLLPQLKAGKPARVVVLSSTAHSTLSVPPYRIFYSHLPAPATPAGYDRVGAYQQSKLANMMFAYEANRRYAESGINAFSVHPGVIKTELFDTIPCACCLGVCGWACLKSIPQGAATTIYCSVSEEAMEKSGEYFADSQWVSGATGRVGEGEFEKLWEWTENFISQHGGVEGRGGDGDAKGDEKVAEKKMPASDGAPQSSSPMDSRGDGASSPTETNKEDATATLLGGSST